MSVTNIRVVLQESSRSLPTASSSPQNDIDIACSVNLDYSMDHVNCSVGNYVLLEILLTV